MPKAKQKPFSRMSAAQKRVAIAKDVLKQINVGQYNIMYGTWLEIDMPSEEQSYHDAANLNPEQTQALLLGGPAVIKKEAKPANCKCCAIGAACASAVRLFNGHAITGGELFEGFDGGLDILKKYFTVLQCRLIEAAFEHRTENDAKDNDFSDTAQKALVRFHEKHDRLNSTQRAKAIFTNIVKNNGTFVI